MDNYAQLVLVKLTEALHNLDFGSALRLLSGDPKQKVRMDWSKIRKADELTRLKIYGMCAEIYDYAGQYDSAREVIESYGRDSEKILRSASPRSEAERRLLKQRVWVVIHWASCFYRTHHYSRARQLLLLCKETLEQRVITDKDKCFLTMSRVYYSLGLVQRQVYDYSAALVWFGESIKKAWESFERRTSTLATSNPEYEKTKRLTDFYTAKSLALGLSWVLYNDGRLLLAESLIHTSLLLVNEVVIRNLIEVVRASILAAEGERAKAIEVLEGAYNMLKAHDAYRIRAANQLAFTHVQEYVSLGRPKDLEAARRYVREVKDFARSHSDIRWECNALIAESRLLRAAGDFRAAEERATEALDVGREQQFIRIDARIARGEARLELKEFGGACKDFDRALADSENNRKAQAVCHLHLCRAYIEKGDHRRALGHLKDAELNLENVENQFVRDFYRKMADVLEETERDDFLVSFSASSLDPRKLEKELHGFLARWAKHHARANREPWDLLGVSKQTFYTWSAKAGSGAQHNKPGVNGGDK